MFGLSPHATFAERLIVLKSARAFRASQGTRKPHKISSEFIVVDYRDLPRKRPYRKGKAHGVRPLEQIRTICLHQTAVMMHHPSRAMAAQYHAMIMPDATIVLCHRPTDYLWHARAANRFSLGLAIVCQAAGVEGDDRTLWRPKTRPNRQPVEATDKQLKAAREVCRYWIETVPSLRNYMAHRQVTPMRASDPGSRIWYEIAENDCNLGIRGTMKGGLKLPREWTGHNVDHGYRSPAGRKPYKGL